MLLSMYIVCLKFHYFLLYEQSAVEKTRTVLEASVEKLMNERSRLDTRCQELEQQLCGTQHRETKWREESESVREQNIKMNGLMELQKAEYEKLTAQVDNMLKIGA